MLRLRLKNGAFIARYIGIIDGIPYQGRIKIDTGCSFTSIALGGFYTGNESDTIFLQDFKSYKNNMFPRAVYSVGVNTRNDPTRKKNIYDYEGAEALLRKDIGFEKLMQSFWLGNFSLGSKYVKVMYRRDGNSLLGMNILKDYHCEIKKEDNETFFYIYDS